MTSALSRVDPRDMNQCFQVSLLKTGPYFITTLFALHFAKLRHLSGGGVDRFRKCSIYVDYYDQGDY